MVDAGAIIRLPGIEIFGDYFRGSGCHFTDMTGWTSTPTLVTDRVAFEDEDGEFDEDGNLAAREVRVVGYLAARSHLEVAEYERRFKSLVHRRFIVSVEDARLDLHGYARLDALTYDASGFHTDAQFEFTLRFPDPRRYGTKRTTPAGTTVTPRHNGDVDARTVFTVTGSMGGYKLVGPAGQEYVVTEALLGGKTDKIDMADGRLYRDGALLIGKSRGERWTTPPGAPEGSVTLVPTTGTGSLVAATRDTYA